MEPLQYSVVAYLRNAVGRFVEELRGDLHPEHAHLPAHLTILPPRTLRVGEREALKRLEELCREVQPFDIVLGEVESFVPTTPTVFLQVEHAAYRLRELHDRLNTDIFQGQEQWPYIPHVTIVKTEEDQRAREALELARRRWAAFSGDRRVRLHELTFVRGLEYQWEDLAPVPLGGRLASKAR